MDDVLLRLEGVHTHIGRYHILHGVDLTVRRGRFTVLLGRNGAGKTTTLRTIMGLWRASAGSVTFDGRRIEAMETPDIARLGIAYVPENMGIFAGLTVRENLLLAARGNALDADRTEAVLELFPALRVKWRSAAGSLSGGQKQMLAIGRAMVEPRRLMIIDEPTKGLAPAVIDQMIEGFRRMRDGTNTILLVEQNFHMARSLGEDVAVMDDGRIVHAGAMDDLAADEGMQQRLLGLSLASHQ